LGRSRQAATTGYLVTSSLHPLGPYKAGHVGNVTESHRRRICRSHPQGKKWEAQQPPLLRPMMLSVV